MDRTRALIAALLVAVVALGVALAIVLADDDDSDQAVVTTPAATVTATEPTPPTTATAESPQAALTQGQAKDAARAGASRAVARFGITIPAGDWDARCTAVGGAARAAVWRCQVTANSGQCAGPLTAYASAPGEAAIRDEQIACGE